MRTPRLALAACVLGLAFALPAAAEDDDIDDFLKELEGSSKPQTGAQEKKDLLAEPTEPEVVLPEELEDRRLIKTLQQKQFMKIGRYEVTPKLGFVTNDPFINRYLIGVDGIAHITEIFAIEGNATFSPDFGVSDWKPITDQLVNENRVSPDISKIIFFSNVNFQYAPIYGKLAVMGDQIINFDFYGTLGSGVVSTRDDLKALQAEGEASAEATKSQVHLTMNYGGGFRVVLPKTYNFAARIEARSLVYIETVDSTQLEYKNNLMLNGGVSFFFPSVE